MDTQSSPDTADATLDAEPAALAAPLPEAEPASFEMSPLDAAQEEALALYSQGKLGAYETKANLGVDFRSLRALMVARNLALPRIDDARATAMAEDILATLGIPVVANATADPEPLTDPAGVSQESG